jgi:predicted secreted Zn-dependent protease
MSADVVNIRDFKRREEREAEIKRFANRLVELGDQIRSLQDTAPCEMPPVQPSYTAPEQDPA